MCDNNSTWGFNRSRIAPQPDGASDNNRSGQPPSPSVDVDLLVRQRATEALRQAVLDSVSVVSALVAEVKQLREEVAQRRVEQQEVGAEVASQLPDLWTRDSSLAGALRDAVAELVEHRETAEELRQWIKERFGKELPEPLDLYSLKQFIESQQYSMGSIEELREFLRAHYPEQWANPHTTITGTALEVLQQLTKDNQ